MAHRPPRDETFIARTHHYRTSTPDKPTGMTDNQRPIQPWRNVELYEFSTAIEIFCTKTAQHVYAECFDIRRLLTSGVNR